MALLRLIGQQGATREKLGEYAASRELRELVDTDYARIDTTQLQEPTPSGQIKAMTLWHLTPFGATAIGVDVDNIGLA